MLKIRLQRVGRKHDPSFRVVVTDSKNGPKSGKALEIVGNYDPRKNVKELNEERVKHWMSKGAQASDTLHNILVDKKIISGKKINVLPKKSPLKKEGEAEEVKVEAPQAQTQPQEAESTPEATPAPEVEAPTEPVAEAETSSETNS